MRVKLRRKIHIWGGLGSQLYGLALALDIRGRFPRSKNLLVFHTSGVTERQLEIEPLLVRTGIDYEKKSDFVARVSTGNCADRNTNIVERSQKFFKSMAYKSHIFARCDFLTDVRFWTLQIRGHYAYRRISTDTFHLIYKALALDSTISKNVNFSSKIVIHYRLGDLLALTEKSEIEFERLYGTIKEVLERNRRVKNLLVLTDSPDACVRKFKTVTAELEDWGICTIIRSESTLNTISIGCHAKTFIGTNSKISFWIVYFRSLISPSTGNNISYVPIENTQAINRVINVDELNQVISYY